LRASGAAGLGLIPLRRFVARPRLNASFLQRQRSPLRSFAHLRIAKWLRSKRRTVREASFTSSGHESFDPCRTIEMTRGLPSSSTTRAGGSGETGPSRSRMIHHVERCRFGDFAARAGSCTDASFSAVFRYPPLRPFYAAQPDDRVLPSGGRPVSRLHARVSLARRRSWGSALRRFSPACGWSRRTSATAKSLATFLSDRAHVPLAPSRPPRFIFVGVTDRHWNRVDQEGGRSGIRMVWASGLRSRLRSASPARTFGRENDPALGFASRRVAGTIAVHRDRARPRPKSSASGDPRPAVFRAAAHLQSAHGFDGVLPDRDMVDPRIAR